ncbi:MAG: hypothetical protein HKN46_09400 [Acidimicrobiia bacterium]|nr:hypothetical protein [Acidimicrobiia bacterium]
MAVPDGLAERHAAAWVVLEQGGSYSEAAKAAGRALGTISKWVAAWRKEFGDDLFRSERQEAAAAQTELARQSREAEWSELRLREARNLGVVGARVRTRLLEILPTVGTTYVDRGPSGTEAPVVVHGLDARQIKHLADAAARLFETAELLDDRPTRHTRRSVPADQWMGAEGPGVPTDPDEMRSKVIDLVGRLKERSSA